MLTGFAVPNPDITIDLTRLYGKFTNAATAVRIASTVDPAAFQHLDTGYVFSNDMYAHLLAFMHDPAASKDVAQHIYSIVQPAQVSEYESGSTNLPVPTNWTGKALLTTGEYDWPACGGNCTITYREGMQDEVYGNLEVYLHPGAGHGVNFGRNATGFFGEIVGFLERNF